MIAAAFILLILACLGVLALIVRSQHREHAMFMELLSHHREERKADWERLDSMIEALANSKGVPYITPSRNYSGELIPTQSYWDDLGQRYWDIKRPITDIKKEEAD